MDDRISRRSINIEGKVTSIALEPVFWEELDRRAKGAGLSWSDYSRQLLNELGAVPNRASSLKQHLMQIKHDTLRSLLIDVTGPECTTRLWCQGSRIIIGRNAGSEIVLNDSKVSRAHAVFIEIDGRWWVGDLHSKNGTRIGRKKIVFEPMPFKKALTIGQYQLQIVQ